MRSVTNRRCPTMLIALMVMLLAACGQPAATEQTISSNATAAALTAAGTPVATDAVPTTTPEPALAAFVDLATWPAPEPGVIAVEPQTLGDGAVLVLPPRSATLYVFAPAPE